MTTSPGLPYMKYKFEKLQFLCKYFLENLSIYWAIKHQVLIWKKVFSSFCSETAFIFMVIFAINALKYIDSRISTKCKLNVPSVRTLISFNISVLQFYKSFVNRHIRIRKKSIKVTERRFLQRTCIRILKNFLRIKT